MGFKPARARRSGETVAAWLLATRRVGDWETARSYEQQVAAGTCSEAVLANLVSVFFDGKPEIDPKTAPARRESASRPAAAAARPVRAAAAAGDPVYDWMASAFGGTTADQLYAEMVTQRVLPQMFPGGPDGGKLPLATASGLDPAAMKNSVLWTRRGIAAEPVLARAVEFNEMAQNDDDAQFLRLETSIVRAWEGFELEIRSAVSMVSQAVTARANDAYYDQQIQQQRRAAAAAASASEEEQYARLFEGSIENRRAAEAAARRNRPSRTGWF